jgi:hypothetical protein
VSSRAPTTGPAQYRTRVPPTAVKLKRNDLLADDDSMEGTYPEEAPNETEQDHDRPSVSALTEASTDVEAQLPQPETRETSLLASPGVTAGNFIHRSSCA